MEGKLKNQPRKGWAKQFKKMHEAGDDKPLIPYFFEDEEFLTDPKAWT
jgi:antitoxin MazE